MATGRLNGHKAKFFDYERFFDAERIYKFSGPEVGFQAQSPHAKHSCYLCFHWFNNPASGWTPCEIMRLGDKVPVPGSGACRFMTPDGKNYPLLSLL